MKKSLLFITAFLIAFLSCSFVFGETILEPIKSDFMYESKDPFELRSYLVPLAEDYAKRNNLDDIYDPGRGEPNFLNTYTRDAFNVISLFASYYIKQKSIITDSLALKPVFNHDYYSMFEEYLKTVDDKDLVKFINESIDYAHQELGIDKDELIFEMVNNSLGDSYPDPTNITKYTGIIVNAFIHEIFNLNDSTSDTEFEYFAVEGGTGGLVYLFNTLKKNYLLKKGDTIAILTPTFPPILQAPDLSEYNFLTIRTQASEYIDWRIPEDELKKLENKNIKALFLVNPTNPTSRGLSTDTINAITEIVKTKNKDLIIITDNVYATFLNSFNPLIKEIPENVIAVYSYSKYFGTTGWRIGIVVMQKNVIADKLIDELPQNEKDELHKRYEVSSLHPDDLSFMERLVRESRGVTFGDRGLSGPQQCFITWCSLFYLSETGDKYKKQLNNVLYRRKKALYDGLEVTMPKGSNQVNYYAFLDLNTISKEKYGKDFAEYLDKNFSPISYLRFLAEEKGIVCILGIGFGGPKWSIRVSMANLNEDSYLPIGRGIIDIMNTLYNQWQNLQ